ncbi:MAG: hypothetical protein LJF04_00335 [Gemmatimonadetes bacterium]|nr:hypothetical protein [Gemmatimonadota bacterium]
MAALALPLIPRAAASQQVNPFGELRLRSIGPAVMGGRIHDVQSLSDDPSTIWVASATGGLWKSTNRGTTWDPVFDGQATGTFGVVAVAPSDHDVVWAGTGEQNNRQSSSWGDGVFRSTDGGKTWTHLGLEDTRAIGRILVDPTNPDVALVGALGNLWAPSEDRGVFRTTDGGKTWSKVLFVDTLTGIVDMARDGADPNLVYAAAYQRLRQPWGYNGGGPGSGIFRSTDGGRTWERLTQGLPSGDDGRIGLAASAHTGGLVYAVVEHATRGGIYRSTDGGSTWQRMSGQNSRPAYYSGLYVDPTNDSRLYLLTRWFYSSEDAGATWRTMPTEPTYDVGLKGDYHAMWIDPTDSRHFYLAGDGGLYQTWDRGATYIRINNIPIGQFYGIGLDDRAPYWIYGGMQDDHSWEGPSATRHYLGIAPGDWREIGFNDGLEHDVDVNGPRYVYSNAVQGDLTLVDAYNGDRRDIHPVAEPGQPPLRWEWMTPGTASRTTAGTYFYGAQRLMVTHDHGTTWSGTEDLTRNIDRDTLSIMGVRGSAPMLSKNDGQSDFSALSAVDQSPVDGSVLWVGSDDGNVQVSRDGGATWTEVAGNMPGAPDGSYISRIEASRAGPGVAYVAVDNHRRGDFSPYAYRTEDFGRTWTSIAAGLPADGSVRFIGEHPDRAGVLFLGTEHALWVSPDKGATWYPLGRDMPATLYMEVEVQPRTHDAVVATHGRSLYILDAASSVAEWTPAVAREPAHLFSVSPSHIWQYWEDYSYEGQDFYAGENPPDGAILDYTLGQAAPAATLTVTNADGDVVRTLTGPGGAGVIHRVVWDLRHDPPPTQPEDPNSPQAHALPRPPRPLTTGPWVSPGTYTVTLKAGNAAAKQTVRVQGDPGKPALTEAQYRARERFLVELLKVQKAAYERLGGPNASPAARRVFFGVSSLAGDFNGSGSVQGSLYPPTPEQRRRLEELKAQLAPGGM